MEKIDSAVDIISTITTKTNLLSLNASIEAARAGEAGRGFAVVATEIQKMAGNTKDATVQIQQMVEDVSAAISEEVATNANETFYSCEDNLKTVEAVQDAMRSLSQLADSLNNR